MTKDNEPDDDLRPVAWAPVPEAPAEVPLGRFDYGDAIQRAEMDGIEELVTDEPLEMVDAPIPLRRPYGRTEKRRNQRPLPT
ncbi:hypothetical protein AB0J86_28735 [Micromonospora sp. NPDC049559]|uniref:hypothetical protein n=1 Tax=Micromonospora sp. NPDC049559 TaxID=3155923 RepID=UPI003437DCD9